MDDKDLGRLLKRLDRLAKAAEDGFGKIAGAINDLQVAVGQLQQILEKQNKRPGIK